MSPLLQLDVQLTDLYVIGLQEVEPPCEVHLGLISRGLLSHVLMDTISTKRFVKATSVGGWWLAAAGFRQNNFPPPIRNIQTTHTAPHLRLLQEIIRSNCWP
ncbi:inositol polyphosphate 5-phosphatase K isoform X1 [Lates japonicus]|uniref:Inositol polyphosphate 5-phosphatase K isoform X1 n=1 Tax=Lates japonicus TaxID=270547 RepID=A0AAD3RL06_LATJO|nr:inositol polyphosphate 5-phosphatase K isoform X1 [Lates japonicus]